MHHATLLDARSLVVERHQPYLLEWELHDLWRKRLGMLPIRAALN